MPSTATITAFYSFIANTKSRANYVNTNFSNFRGHIIAIDPNTSTAATTETYDLGSTEYRWRTGYFREVDFKSNTSTGQALQIVGDTAAGNGAFLLKVGSNIRSRLGNGAQYFDGDTNTTYDFRVNGSSVAKMGSGNVYLDLDTTTSQFDFKVAGATVGSYKSTGIQRYSLRNSAQGTYLNKAYTGNTGLSITLVGTLSITSNTNNCIVGYNIININTNASSGIQTYRNDVGTGDQVNLDLFRDGTSAANLIKTFKYNPPGYPTSTISKILWIDSFSTFDTSITAGNHTYYLYLTKGATNTAFIFTGDFAYIEV